MDQLDSHRPSESGFEESEEEAYQAKTAKQKAQKDK
jgi:hypothetical protein